MAPKLIRKNKTVERFRGWNSLDVVSNHVMVTNHRVSVCASLTTHHRHNHDSRKDPKRRTHPNFFFFFFSSLSTRPPRVVAHRLPHGPIHNTRNQSSGSGVDSRPEEEEKEKEGGQGCLQRSTTTKAVLRCRTSSRALHQQKQALEIYQLIPRQSTFVLSLAPSCHISLIRHQGPWLQLPLELLESLLVLNLDPATLSNAKIPSHSSRIANSPHSTLHTRALPRPREIDRGLHTLSDHSPPDSPRHNFNPLPSSYTTPLLCPIPGKPTPPPIDPGVFRNVAAIRRLIDEAAELSVRASSGLSPAALASMRGGSHSAWPTAQSLGLDGSGNMGGGRNVAMSAMRVHRLRALAVHKLAAAYKADEIASSVMVMQGGSVFDDVAERVLRHGTPWLVTPTVYLSEHDQ